MWHTAIIRPKLLHYLNYNGHAYYLTLVFFSIWMAAGTQPPPVHNTLSQLLRLIQVMSLHSATRPHEDIPPCIITTHPARGITCASDSTFAMRCVHHSIIQVVCWLSNSSNKNVFTCVHTFFRDILSIRNLLEAESSMQSLPPTSESNNAALPSTFTSGIKSSLSVEMGDNSNNLSKQPVSNAAIVACDVNELKAHVSCRPQILTMWSSIPPAGRHGSAYYPPHIDGPDIDQITGYDPAVIEYLAKRYAMSL